MKSPSKSPSACSASWLATAAAILTIAAAGCAATHGSRPPTPTPLNTLGPALFEANLAAATAYALTRHPEASGAVRAASEVICAAAVRTNLSPAALLQAVTPYLRDNPQADLIVRFAIADYTAVHNALIQGASGVPPEAPSQYLEALCRAFTTALAFAPPPPAPGAIGPPTEPQGFILK